jgi:hypothetical protein
MKATVFGACAAVALTAGVLAAQGVNPDRSTFVTVSGPVSLPGVTLPAGTYLFRLADTQASRNVVQIFDRDRTKIFATLIAIPATRNEPSDESVITFKETPSDRPPAIHYWYYAGETSGQEFAYPKSQAMQIASASGESVLSVETTGTDFESMKSGEITRVQPGAATESAAQPQTTPATEPQSTTPQSTSPATTTQPAEPQPAAPQTQPAPEPQAATPPAPTAEQPAPTTRPSTPETTSAPMTPAQPESAARPRGTTGTGTTGAAGTTGELPRTASGLPLVRLFGFLALGAGLAAHGLRRRMMV